MAWYGAERPFPDKQFLKDVEKALEEFKGFEIKPDQRRILAEYLTSQVKLQAQKEISKDKS